MKKNNEIKIHVLWLPYLKTINPINNSFKSMKDDCVVLDKDFFYELNKFWQSFPTTEQMRSEIVSDLKRYLELM